ncbi:ATP-dependent DNA ligase [Herbiconiux sp. VKM Ac-1786]|uniref:DUF7882 family protein n=1 Tax=Herbiconiux sp. VKM Ac-1786 TaxID=2783824 RepID=UPI00188CF147|nr:ATP-dependent DNA ligase [Herbiconiux sp. VKM Ac-1786]MBF4573898.1 ATP-dependent DNA ligase [Herbiconiux sp. VKM Ac-1786]
MGRLSYAGTTVDFDDRTLAHLHAVIGAKLRRGEGFHFSWSDGQSGGNGRTSIWVRPEMPLVLSFHRAAAEPLNRRWIDELMRLANSPSGLQLRPEPEP